MLSKHNVQGYLRKIQNNKQRFSIRKLSVGVASVLIGLTFMGVSANASQVKFNGSLDLDNNQTYSVTKSRKAAVSVSKTKETNSQSSSANQSVSQADSKVQDGSQVSNKQNNQQATTGASKVNSVSQVKDNQTQTQNETVVKKSSSISSVRQSSKSVNSVSSEQSNQDNQNNSQTKQAVLKQSGSSQVKGQVKQNVGNASPKLETSSKQVSTQTVAVNHLDNENARALKTSLKANLNSNLDLDAVLPHGVHGNTTALNDAVSDAQSEAEKTVGLSVHKDATQIIGKYDPKTDSIDKLNELYDKINADYANQVRAMGQAIQAQKNRLVNFDTSSVVSNSEINEGLQLNNEPDANVSAWIENANGQNVSLVPLTHDHGGSVLPEGHTSYGLAAPDGTTAPVTVIADYTNLQNSYYHKTKIGKIEVRYTAQPQGGSNLNKMDNINGVDYPNYLLTIMSNPGIGFWYASGSTDAQVDANYRFFDEQGNQITFDDDAWITIKSLNNHGTDGGGTEMVEFANNGSLKQLYKSGVTVHSDGWAYADVDNDMTQVNDDGTTTTQGTTINNWDNDSKYSYYGSVVGHVNKDAQDFTLSFRTQGRTYRDLGGIWSITKTDIPQTPDTVLSYHLDAIQVPITRDYRIVEKLPDGTQKVIYHIHAVLYSNADGKYVDDTSLGNTFTVDPYEKILDYKTTKNDDDNFDGVKVDELSGYTWAINDNGQHLINGKYPGAVSVWRVNKGDSIVDDTGTYVTNADGVMFDLFQGTTDNPNVQYYDTVAPSQDFYINYTPQYVTVTPDLPETPSDVLPDNPNLHYPTGVGYDDLHKTVTRTIYLNNPNKTIKMISQTVSFVRSAKVNEGTGEVDSYTDWTADGDDTFAAFDAPAIAGYIAPSVEEAKPNGSWKDTNVILHYTPLDQTTHINFIDEQGNQIKQDTISGKTDQTVETNSTVPTGWVIASGTVPAEITFKGANTPDTTIIIKHGTQDVSDSDAEAKRTVTRTVNITDPHTQKVDTTTQTVTFTRTATKDLVTGKTAYGDWSENGKHEFNSVNVPVIAGYIASGDAPSVVVTPNSKDSKVDIMYNANNQETHINYVDEQGNRIKQDVINGKTDQTVDVDSVLPTGWKIVSGTVPKQIAFSGAVTPDTTIVIKHGLVKVTSDNPKTTDDVLPDNPNLHYPAGLTKDDLTKVVTRTINVKGLDGNTSLLRMQSVKFTRTATVDEVTGKAVYDDWVSNGDAVFDEVSAPEIAGYKADKDAQQVTVTPDMTNSTVTISYIAQPQSFKVIYQDEDGNPIKTVAENGKTGQTIDLTYQAPTGWVIENQAQLPTNVVLKGSDNQDVVVTIKHGSITVTPDSPKTSDDVLPDNPNLHYPSGLTKDDLSKTVTRVVKITDPHTHKVATTNQTVTFTRNAQVDEVSGTVSYDNWTENGEHDFDAVDVPTIAGYTPSTNNVSKITVTPDTESSEIDITYTANDGTQTIQYVDKDGNVIGTQIINGKTDEQKTVEADVPDGWTATTDIPSTVTIKPTDTPIKVTIGHGQANVDADHPVKPGDLIPGTKDKHYGKGLDTDDLNHTVTRVVKITDPHTKQTKTITQTVKFSRNATVDMVTGNVLSYTDWSPVGEDSFVAIDVPVVAGYTASGSVDKTTPQESDQDSEIDITYAPNVQTTHINYVDEQGEQIKQDTFNGKTDETVNINSRVPAGWIIVKGIVPKTITFAGTGTPDVSIIIKHQTVRISSNSPKTTDDVLPDNPNMHYPAGLTENDLSRTVSRVISITDPHTKKTATTLQTVTFLRTADVDEVTGKATYSPWTENGSHVFVAVDVPKVAGYTASGDAPQITITPDTKSSALDITYSADSHTTHIVYVDEQGNTVKTTTITGKTDQTVATNSTVPEGWVIKSGTIPMQISFTADEVPDTRITIAHGLVTVTPDNPKTQDDVLPNLPDKSYPAGVAEHDLNRVVTRTITLTDPNGKKTSKVQSVKFIRNATVDEVTGTVTYGKWSENGKHIFNATVATPIDGYTVKGSAPQVEVTPDSQDINVDLSYVANDQSTHIFFVDDSNKLIKSYTVTGKTGETVKTNAQVPTGWTIEKGTVPAEITFKGAHTADTTIVIKHGVVVVTPDNPKTTSDVLPDDSSKHFPAGLTKDDLSRTVTRSIEIINPYSGKSQQTQTVTFTRNAFFDEVTDKVTYGDWTENGSHKFDTILVPLVAGYHASGTVPEITVTPDTKSSNVVITYSANKVIQTVEYVDAQGNVVGKQIVDGLTDATVPFTPQVPTGWKLVNDAPKQFKLKAIDTPVKLNVVHNSITVTHDHPEPNGTLIPGTKDKYFGPGLDANDLNQTVTRTIEVIDPISKETKIHEQHVSFIRDANVDQVTGKVISYTDWKADGQDFFAEFVAPEIEGYTVSDKGKAEKLTPKADDPDTTVRLSYVPNKQLVKIIYSDANGKVIKTDIVNGVTDSTVDSGSFVPAGWVVSNGTIPERIHFVASSLPDIHVTVEHGKATVHSDDPKTTSDTLPDNYGQHYPEGVAKNDLSKTVTRTIIITNPDGSKTTKQQAVTFTRDAVVDEVNGQVAYGKWSEDGLHEFDEFFAPEIKGYTANGHAKRATVTPDSQNTVVEIAYAGDTHKAKILYVDPDGRLIHETDLQGTTDSTIQIPNEVPAEYHAVGDVPSTLKFGAEDHAAIVVSVAPNAKQVSQNKTLKREITVHLPNGKEETEIQTAVLTRLGTQDEVSKAVDWQPWSTSVFHVFVPDDIQGYVTPRVSAETVTGNSTNEQVDISYTPTRQTLVVEFVDQNGSVVKTELISGKTGETKRIDYDVDGYKLVSQDLPNTFTFNGQNKTMMVKVEPVQTETQSQQSTLDKNSAENTDNQADNQTDTDLDNNQRDNMGAKKETAKPEQKAKPTPKPKANKTNTPAQKGVQKTLPKAKAKSSVNAQKPSESVNHADEDIKQPVKNALLPQTSDNSSELGLMALGVISMLLSAGMIGAEWKKKVD